MQNKVINIITVCLLLVSTTGFSLSRHYCGDVLVEVAVNKQAETCCSDSDCCDTETDFYQLDEDFVGTYSALFKPELLPLGDLISVASIFHANPNTPKNYGALTDGISPPTRQRFQVAYQVFLL
ncbi:MAG: HYC_CC_PP family protein [Bacteroidota bacterium]